MAACAQVSFIPPWSGTVPVTGQTFGVLFTAVLLGSHFSVVCVCFTPPPSGPPTNQSGKTIGVFATIFYLIEGVVMGLPFFSSGSHGWSSLLGPTGGYLEGFILAAWVVVRSNRPPFDSFLHVSHSTG